MIDGDRDLTEEDLAEIFRLPDPISALTKRLPDLGPAALDRSARHIAELHNNGQLELPTLVAASGVMDWPLYRRYDFDRFMDMVVPHLLMATPDMMAFVTGLSGNEQGLHLTGFKRWCQADPSRWRAVLEARPIGREQPFLHAAMQASDDLEVIEEALERGGVDRVVAIQSLGRLSPDQGLRARSLALLAKHVDVASDDEAARVLDAASYAATQGVSGPIEGFGALARRIAKGGGPLVRAQVAQSLSLFAGLLTRSWVADALDALAGSEPTDAAEIDRLDQALANLVRHGHGAQAIDFLTEYLSTDHVNLGLSQFDDFGYALKQSSLLGATLARWLILGLPRICRDLPELLVSTSIAGVPLALPLADLKPSSDEMAFMSRKAVGFLFVQPVAAASVLVEVLRVGDANSSEQAARLLFDPLLIDFPGSVGDYLGKIAPDDRAHAGVRASLELGAAYQARLDAVGVISELEPSEDQREIRRRRHRDEMTKMQEASMERSIFRDIFPVSRILHGTSVRSVLSEPDGQSSIFETQMATSKLNWEIPRGDVADTVGRHHQILQYKMEGRKP